MQATVDKVVLIDYTLTDDEGNVLDSSEEDGPLAYLHGADNIIPGLEQALEGKTAGDEFRVTLAAADAYGDHDPELVQSVPRAQFPRDMDPEIGDQLQAETPEGPRIVTIVKVDPGEITVDANHPLAGVPLNFAVKIVEVRDATREELDHGHVHGPGGHHH
ncbi:MAG: peptidylprolyl isomerase [Planctomycetales bacterium]